MPGCECEQIFSWHLLITIKIRWKCRPHFKLYIILENVIGICNLEICIFHSEPHFFIRQILTSFIITFMPLFLITTHTIAMICFETLLDRCTHIIKSLNRRSTRIYIEIFLLSIKRFKSPIIRS